MDPRIHHIYVPPTDKLIRDIGTSRYRELDPNDKIILNNEIVELFNSGDQFILLSGLAGYSGGFLTKALTLKLHASNKNFKTICSLPFRFEGTKNRNNALAALNPIRHLPEVKYLDHEYLRQKYSDLRLSNCYDLGNMEFWNIYKSF